MYWVIELCKSKCEVKLYRMQDYEQFRRIMCQCELVSGDMEPLAVLENGDVAMQYILKARKSIRENGFVKTQDGRIINLHKANP